MDNQQEFEGLLAKFVQTELDASEMQQLGEFIKASKANRQQYLEHCQMHAILMSEHGLLSAVVTPTKTQRLTSAIAHRKFAWILATAALLAGVAFFFADQRPYRGSDVALLSRSVGAHFAYGVDGESEVPAGTRLVQGPYQLQSGLMEVLYDSGAVLILEGPAEFELVDTDAIRIDHGRLAAHVPEAAIGFRVDTVAASVIDLGTDFAVSARKNQQAEVHVFEGEVRVELDKVNGVSHNPLSLTAGKATRVDNRTGLPSGIELNELEFLRNMPVAENAYSHAVKEMNPAVYYRMEPGEDGLVLFDSSSASAHATVVPGLKSDPVWAAGKVGVAFEMGGPAEQTYAYASEYPQSPDGKLSIVVWVYANSRPRWGSIAKNWAELDVDWDYHAGQIHFGLFDDEGVLEAHIATGHLEEVFVMDSVPIPLNRWVHVAVVADGTHLKLYRDGELIDIAAYEKHVYDPALKTLAIGTKLGAKGYAQANPGWATWDGRLDELAMFNHALTDEQVRQLYELSADGI